MDDVIWLWERVINNDVREKHRMNDYAIIMIWFWAVELICDDMLSKYQMIVELNIRDIACIMYIVDEAKEV